MTPEQVMNMLRNVARTEPDFIGWLRGLSRDAAMDSRLSDAPAMYRMQGSSLGIESLADMLERARRQ